MDELKQNLRDASAARFQVDVELIASKDEIEKLEIGKKTLADQLAETDERYGVLILPCFCLVFVCFHVPLLYSPSSVFVRTFLFMTALMTQ